MNTSKQQLAEFAAMCIDALDARAGRPLNVIEISRAKGIPVATCLDVLRRLAQAGIVRLDANQAVLIREDITALEVVEAVWKKQDQTPSAPIRMLAGFTGGVQIGKTLEFLSRSMGQEGING